MRFGIALLVIGFTVAAAHVAHGGDRLATRAPALLTFAATQGGICAVRADGSHGLRLTPPWRLSEVAWSPDGRYAAFIRATASSITPSKISVADARGRIRWRFGSRRIGFGSRRIHSPLWAPDGQHIAYLAYSAGGYGLWLSVARRDGSDDHDVGGDLGFPGGPDHPSWSPDGQRISFDGGYESRHIYSVRVDGSDRRTLVADAIKPAYSPDGTRLAYVGYGGGNNGIFVADADGSDPYRVSPRGVGFDGFGPLWSPDSTRLVFASLASPEVVVARADGSGERVIADLGTSWVRSTPQWSPDGKLVAFVQSPADHRRVTSSIVVARADARGWRVIARERDSRRDLESLAWRPAVVLPAAKRVPCRRR
jgi:Tol biopolymer transport system component